MNHSCTIELLRPLVNGHTANTRQPIPTGLVLAAMLLLAPLASTATTEGPYTYTVSGGKATITDFSTSYFGPLSIASTLGGYPVTSIGSAAFYYCFRLTSATIPSNVTSIGSSAFRECTSLTGVLFNGDAPTSVGSGIFDFSTPTVYRPAGASGWGATFSGRPVEIWCGWEAGVQLLGGGWRRLAWFGDYVPMGGDGWIWHNRHGFLYIPTDSVPWDIWLYDQSMGWLWTDSTIYPFLFRNGDGAWLWYNGCTNPRCFVNMATGHWEYWP